MSKRESRNKSITENYGHCGHIRAFQFIKPSSWLILFCVIVQFMSTSSVSALDGGTLRLNTFNEWRAFEVISQADDPSGDGVAYSMLGKFDGAGAWLVDSSTLRVHVNHETTDAAISEVNLDLPELQNMISSGSSGNFVNSARQAYDRWSSNGGVSWLLTSNTSNTSFSRFCSGQAYAPGAYGTDRGFVDQVYITGEEIDNGRLFALDSINRDLYQLSGTVGNALGGNGGMPFDSWENAALLDTGETSHIALLLSPDGGSEAMQIYIGEKGKDSNGSSSNSFLARNGLAFGSWYYLKALFPAFGNSNNGSFDSSALGALVSDKLEDVDTSPSDPTRAVLADQTSGVFILNFNFIFDANFDSNASSFTIAKISNNSGGTDSLNNPDNVEWTDATMLYPDGLVFVNEDNSSGEVWQMEPDGSNKLRIASTTIRAESTGIFDISRLIDYPPGSILITNNQGFPSSMSVLINPSVSSTTPADEICLPIKAYNKNLAVICL